MNITLNLITFFILCRFRHVYWNGGYFGCIHQVKSLLPKPDVCAVLYCPKLDLNFISFLQSPQAQLMNNFVSGSIGGFAGTVLNTP